MQKQFVLLFIWCCLAFNSVASGARPIIRGAIVETSINCNLPAPTNLQRVFVQPNTVVYTWNAVPGAVKYYAVLTDLTLGGIVVSQDPIGPTITFGGLIAGHSYQFTVAAMCAEKEVSVNMTYDYFLAPNIIIDLIADLPYGCSGFGTSIGNYNATGSTYTCYHNWQTNHEYWMRIPTGVSEITLRFNKSTILSNHFDLAVVDPSGSLYTLTCLGQPCYEARLSRNGSPMLTLFFPDNGGVATVSLNNSPFTFTVHDGCGMNFGGGGEKLEKGSNYARQMNLTTAPNPFTDLLTFYFPDAKQQDVIKARLIDLRGKVYVESVIEQQEAPDGFYTIPTETLPAGMYFLQMETTSGQMVTRKVMKVSTN